MRNTLALAAILLATVIAPQQAFACSCVGYENDEERNIAAYGYADIVLQGSAISLEEKAGKHVYTVSVEKVWKGKADAYIEIETADNSAACGINLPLDESTVIFIHEYENTYNTGLCSGTTTSSKELVNWLNEYDGGTEPSCEPYICDNGEQHPSCTEDGNPINYIVHPCQFTNSEEDEDEEIPTEETVFTDVPDDHSNAQAIMFVRSEGIVKGYDDGTFRPDQTINRAEFTKIIIAANFSPEEIDACESDNLFSDVTQHDWFADFVCIAKNSEVIGGYEDGSFKPGNSVNFAEAAKIVVNAFVIETDPEDHLGIWWRPYVFALARIGGLPQSFTDPNQLLTRGEMAEIIYRVMTGM